MISDVYAWIGKIVNSSIIQTVALLVTDIRSQSIFLSSTVLSNNNTAAQDVLKSSDVRYRVCWLCTVRGVTCKVDPFTIAASVESRERERDISDGRMGRNQQVTCEAECTYRVAFLPQKDRLKPC